MQINHKFFLGCDEIFAIISWKTWKMWKIGFNQFSETDEILFIEIIKITYKIK